MGLAFKCDRCGGYYDPPIHNKSKGILECILNKYGRIEQIILGQHGVLSVWKHLKNLKQIFKWRADPILMKYLKKSMN